MRMEGEPPCGWTRGFHADGLWGRCSLSLFADPLDFTISDGHADRELHGSAHVAPALAYGGPCPVDVVLRVRPAVAMPDDGGDRPAPELALPCRERDVVYSREVPQRCPRAPAHVLVPGRPEDFALPVREV